MQSAEKNLKNGLVGQWTRILSHFHLVYWMRQDLRHCVRRFFPKFLFSRVSEIAIFWKLGSERVFRAFSELVPTRENSFRLETRLKISDKSLECRALTRLNFRSWVEFANTRPNWRPTLLIFCNSNNYTNTNNINSLLQTASRGWPRESVQGDHEGVGEEGERSPGHHLPLRQDLQRQVRRIRIHG